MEENNFNDDIGAGDIPAEFVEEEKQMAVSDLCSESYPAYVGNYSGPAARKNITAITIHHMAGVCSAKTCGQIFQRPGRNGSSHYGIGVNGEIAWYVDESCVAWTNSNWPSNQCSVTIECSNSEVGGEWPVSEVTLNQCINLVADIAKRNGLGKLVPGQNLTWHSMFAPTTCPGDYLRGKMQYIADTANKINGYTPAPTPTPTPTPTQPQAPAPSKPHHNINDNQVVRMGPQTHNGPCTPPQRSDVFSNKILTSGQYQQSDPAFEKIMITTFRAEGGCGNHPNDSGGYTCYGISQNNNPEVDVRNITRADAENIAHRKYYTKYGLDKLPDYIRSDVFTFGWASGPVTAIHNLCRVLGLPKRNKIDSEIVMATENYNGDLHNDYLDAMQQYFIKCAQKPKQNVFLTGWMNRVKFTRENSCHYPTTDPIYR